MLTPFDDFPIHQTPEPIAQTVSADPNHYDRYFFDGFDQVYDDISYATGRVLALNMTSQEL